MANDFMYGVPLRHTHGENRVKSQGGGGSDPAKPPVDHLWLLLFSPYGISMEICHVRWACEILNEAF